jgi:hypothetical protein
VHPVDYNLAMARAMLDELEAFLQSPDVFWPLSHNSSDARSPFPRLSLGVVLMTLDELRAAEPDLAPAELTAIQVVEREFDRIKLKWTVAVEHKALGEMSQRLSIWRAYLQDLSESRSGAEDYPMEVRQRVALARLLDLAGRNPGIQGTAQSLSQLDDSLRASFEPGEFIWDQRLKAVYAPAGFWFLFGRPRM